MPLPKPSLLVSPGSSRKKGSTARHLRAISKAATHSKVRNLIHKGGSLRSINTRLKVAAVKSATGSHALSKIRLDPNRVKARKRLADAIREQRRKNRAGVKAKVQEHRKMVVRHGKAEMFRRLKSGSHKLTCRPRTGSPGRGVTHVSL